MSNNVDLLLNSLRLAKKFLLANLGGKFFVNAFAEDVETKGLYWPATIAFGQSEGDHNFVIGLERSRDHPKVLITSIAVDAGRGPAVEEKIRKRFVPNETFNMAYGKQPYGPLWVIEKPIDIITFFKTFNQLSLDLGYEPLFKS